MSGPRGRSGGPRAPTARRNLGVRRFPACGESGRASPGCSLTPGAAMRAARRGDGDGNRRKLRTLSRLGPDGDSPRGPPRRPCTLGAMAEHGTLRVKTGLAEMFKGGVIMDVVDADQAKIAEDAGACAVMALERVPADIRAQGGVARMSDPEMIRGIQAAVSIPVMAKCRIGHFVEAQILEALEVDYIDESEVLTPADVQHHVDKWAFTSPLRLRCDQPRRGASPHRRRRGDDPHQGRSGHRRHRQRRYAHARACSAASGGCSRSGRGAVRRGEGASRPVRARPVGRRERPPAGRHLHRRRHRDPADAALCMQLGADGVFVGSGIFKSGRDRTIDPDGSPWPGRLVPSPWAAPTPSPASAA